jgi:uncharacterized membrane protein YheB (UPF0754 family)
MRTENEIKKEILKSVKTEMLKNAMEKFTENMSKDPKEEPTKSNEQLFINVLVHLSQWYMMGCNDKNTSPEHASYIKGKQDAYAEVYSLFKDITGMDVIE